MKDYKRTRVKNQRQKKGKAGRKKKNIFSLRNRTFIYAIIIFIFVSASVFYIWKYVQRSLFDIEFLKAKNVSVNGNRNLSEEEIKKLSEKYDYKDFAILVRANSHADPFIRQCARKGIPYQFLGPGYLFQQEEIKNLNVAHGAALVPIRLN